jgi:HSP20 family protein
MRLSLSLSALAALFATVISTAEGRHSGTLMPRHYVYHRGPLATAHREDPMDVVTSILTAPLYHTPWESTFNSLFQQYMSQTEMESKTWTPRYEVTHDRDTVELTMEVPGVTTRDLQVTLEEERILRIHGSRHVKRNGAMMDTTFDQTFRLEDHVDASQLQATLSHGILRVTVPKREPRIHRIAITTGSDASDTVAITTNVPVDEVSNDEKETHPDHEQPAQSDKDDIVIHEDDA